MCHFEIVLNLHCGHCSFIPRACTENPTRRFNKDGSHYATSPAGIASCPHYLLPSIHSYLTCCEHCSEKMHEILTSPNGDDTLYCYLSSRACGPHMVASNTFKTCDRLRESSDLLNDDSSIQIKANGNKMKENGFNLGDGNSSDTRYLFSPTSPIKLLENYEMAYLRFACGHGQDFLMPKATFEANGSPKANSGMAQPLLRCGCYAGSSPQLPVAAMIMVESLIPEDAFKPVWEVTGSCWKFCGGKRGSKVNRYGGCLWGEPREFTAYHVDQTVVDAADPAVPGNGFKSKAQSIDYFLTKCKEWEDFEKWKVVAFSGDAKMNGSRLKADSRFASKDD